MTAAFRQQPAISFACSIVSSELWVPLRIATGHVALAAYFLRSSAMWARPTATRTLSYLTATPRPAGAKLWSRRWRNDFSVSRGRADRRYASAASREENSVGDSSIRCAEPSTLIVSSRVGKKLLVCGPPTSPRPWICAGYTAAKTWPTRPPRDWPAMIALSRPTYWKHAYRSEAYSSAEES